MKSKLDKKTQQLIRLGLWDTAATVSELIDLKIKYVRFMVCFKVTWLPISSKYVIRHLFYIG